MREQQGPLGMMISGRQPIGDLLISARDAEAAGFHSLWAGDGGGDVFGLLTAYALHTSRVLLGSAVAVWHRPPVVAGSAAGQLQRMSDGRFILGLGAGPKDWNERWWGISYDKPIGRMKEYIEVIRGSLGGSTRAPYSYHGAHFQIDSYRGPSLPVNPIPPVWIGTVGAQMNALAGRVADGVIFDVVLPIPYLRDVALPAVERGLRAAGRDRAAFTVAAMISCCIDSDRSTALRGVKRAAAGHLGQEYFFPIWAAIGHEEETRRAQAKMRDGDLNGAIDALSDDFARKVGVAGTPDECRAQLRAWQEFLDLPILIAPPFHAPPEYVAGNRARIIETFGVA